MFTEAQRRRFSELQQREEDGVLNASERKELNELIQIVEAAEKETLQPATEQIRQERLQIQAQNAALKTLMHRQERLVRRLERMLALSQTENAAIQSQLSEILRPTSAGANRS